MLPAPSGAAVGGDRVFLDGVLLPDFGKLFAHSFRDLFQIVPDRNLCRLGAAGPQRRHRNRQPGNARSWRVCCCPTLAAWWPTRSRQAAVGPPLRRLQAAPRRPTARRLRRTSTRITCLARCGTASPTRCSCFC